MKKIIVAPDSFKGTLSATEVCRTISKGLSRSVPKNQIHSLPIADGGEGTVECCLCLKGAREKQVTTVDALMRKITVSYALIEDTAIIEMASVAGYSQNRNPDGTTMIHPLKTTTFGVGELILDAARQGVKRIIVGLGGSCTNDAGTGMASALGTVFRNYNDRVFPPVGDTLHTIAEYDTSQTESVLSGIEIIGMHDTRAVMYGPEGAAFVYAPQKGASKEDVIHLDNGLRALSDIIQKQTGQDISQIEGTGAAGALGAGIIAFLGGKLVSGTDLILSMTGYEELLDDCSFVITGEGKFDRQTLSGKAVSGIAELAKKHNVPVLIIAGMKEDGLPPLEDFGIQGVWMTGNLETGLPYEELKKRCIDRLEATAIQVGQYIASH